jgi:zinc protease
VEQAIHEEFVRLLRDGVMADEVERGKQGFLEAQKVRRTTDVALAGWLSDLSYAGRTMTYQAEFEKSIADLTPEQVVSAVRKHLDPEKLVVVTAGDFGTKAEAGRW